jgi:hypothetical protein
MAVATRVKTSLTPSESDLYLHVLVSKRVSTTVALLQHHYYPQLLCKLTALV